MEVRQNPLPDFERIEIQAYDMFTPQAIIRAQAIYFRSVLHDWPDDKRRDILEDVKADFLPE
ncbi:hypothetical protein APSETT444_007917 [Aspergillus pseudonomiae]